VLGIVLCEQRAHGVINLVCEPVVGQVQGARADAQELLREPVASAAVFKPLRGQTLAAKKGCAAGVCVYGSSATAPIPDAKVSRMSSGASVWPRVRACDLDFSP